MARANGSAPPEAIRIEDEVWQEAFTRREPASESRRRRLRAIDGGRSDSLRDQSGSLFDQADSLVDQRDWLSGQSDWLSGQNDWLSEQSDWLSGPVPDPSPEATVSVAPEAMTPSPQSESARSELPAATWLGQSASYDTTPPVRRTVKIQGRGAERNLPLPDPSRRRPSRRAYERAGFRPDRLAMWAVLLGFLLVFVAIASGHS